jgi:hypothetical protein
MPVGEAIGEYETRGQGGCTFGAAKTASAHRKGGQEMTAIC